MNRRVLFCACLATMVSLMAFGCGDDDDKETGLITLSEITPDPVPVQLSGNIGAMVFDFSAHPLAVDHSEELVAVLHSGGITLNVVNDQTGVNHNLVSGTVVEGDPASAGEYSVVASDDGTVVTVTFFNSFDGSQIHTNTTYLAAVDVIENGFFTVESFARGVLVTQ